MSVMSGQLDGNASKLTDHPSDHDSKGQDEQSDLHAGPDSYANGKVHLIFAGNSNGGRVLCGVADDGEKNQSDEGLRNVAPRCDRIDRVNLGARRQ